MEKPQLTSEAQLLIEEQVSSLVARDRRRFLSMIVAGLTITVGVFGLSIQSTSKRVAAELIDSVAVREIDNQIERIRHESDALRSMTEAIKADSQKQLADILSSLEQTPELPSTGDTKEVLAKITRLTVEVDSLKIKTEEASALLTALGSEATKTLAVPILRKDLDALSARVEASSLDVAQDLASLRTSVTTEMSRVYDLGKWFLGLILAVSVIPIIEPFFGRRKRAAEAAKTSGEEAVERVTEEEQKDA